MKKYEDLYVIDGKITVPVANKKGKITGTTELLLKNVFIKVPKQEIFGFNPVIKKIKTRKK